MRAEFGDFLKRLRPSRGKHIRSTRGGRIFSKIRTSRGRRFNSGSVEIQQALTELLKQQTLTKKIMRSWHKHELIDRLTTSSLI